MTLATAVEREALDSAEIQAFHRDGYLILPGYFAATAMAGLIREIDELVAAGSTRDAYARPAHGLLTSHPPLMGIVGQLLGPGFLFHHVHTYRHPAGTPGVAWHNDYEQVPQTNRSHRNLIALIYPDGLHGEVGDLVVVPGTHGIVSDWYQLSCFGTATLPGEVVVDRLAPGSVVLAHTGLLHCRRPRGGARPRYFTDTSYCQRGIRWPAWSEGDWRAMYRTCRERGYDRGGRFAHLYDDSCFFDQIAARERLKALNDAGGSLWPLIERGVIGTT